MKLRTDNSAVSWIRTLKNPTGQVFCWLQYIETYDISVTHRPGRPQRNADTLSCIPCKVCQRQEQNRSKDPDEHDPDLHTETGSDQKPQTELSYAVTRGQQQNEATAQLKPNQFLLANWGPSTVRERQLSDPIISPIMVAVESQSQPEWKSINAYQRLPSILKRYGDNGTDLV